MASHGFLKNIFVGFLVVLSFCTKEKEAADNQSAKAEIVKPVILDSIPHDTAAFTQGLLYHEGYLYESTGLYGHSSIRKLDLKGVVVKKSSAGDIFAEGLALMDSSLFQLSWKAQYVFVYNLRFEKTDSFRYEGEGWGLTSADKTFYMSNGSDSLYLRDSEFNLLDKIGVRIDQKPLTNLNELEYVDQRIYANVWYSDYVFEIAVPSGVVLRMIDCSELINLERPLSEHHVLNGIAFNPDKKVFYLTGKKWKCIYIVKIPE